jgi:hypothetical protein
MELSTNITDIMKKKQMYVQKGCHNIGLSL